MALVPARVTPKSSQSRIEWQDGFAKIWVRANPAGGEANSAACELLAKHLSVPPTSVRIARGHTSRAKLISVENLSLEEVEHRLRSNS